VSGLILQMLERLAGAEAWRRYGTLVAELRSSLPAPPPFSPVKIGPIFDSPEEFARDRLQSKHGGQWAFDMLMMRHSYILGLKQMNPWLLPEISKTEDGWIRNFLDRGRADQFRGRVRHANGFIRNLDRTDFGPRVPSVRVDIDALIHQEGTALIVIELNLRERKRRPSTIAAEATIEAELRAGVKPGEHGGPTLKEFARTVQEKTRASEPYSAKHLSRLIAKVRNKR
jgi:hypothetical protein